MSFVLFVVGFLIGGAVGAFFYANTMLPILFSLPTSIWLVMQRKLRPLAIVYCLLTPVIWIFAAVGLGAFVSAIWPDSWARFTGGYVGAGFGWGSNLALLGILAKLVTKSGRQEIRSEFEETTMVRFGIGSLAQRGGVALGDLAEKTYRDTGAIPQDLRLDIIAVYGRAIEAMEGIHGSITALPATKAIVGEAILEELTNNLDLSDEMMNRLEFAYEELAAFLPADDFNIVRRSEATLTAFANAIRSGSANSSPLNEDGAAATSIRERVDEERKARRQELRKLFGRKKSSIWDILGAEIKMLDFQLEQQVSYIQEHWPEGGERPDRIALRTELVANFLAMTAVAAERVKIGEGLSKSVEVYLYVLMKQKFPDVEENPLFGEAFDACMEGVFNAFPEIHAVGQFLWSRFTRRFDLSVERSEVISRYFFDELSRRLIRQLEAFMEYKQWHVVTEV